MIILSYPKNDCDMHKTCLCTQNEREPKSWNNVKATKTKTIKTKTTKIATKTKIAVKVKAKTIKAKIAKAITAKSIAVTNTTTDIVFGAVFANSSIHKIKQKTFETTIDNRYFWCYDKHIM